ncbi:hypothetical protein ACHQM5_016193 [Ranunculus cassubicifolius]
MADKPSRGLVFYGDGLIQFVTPSHTYLHEFASRGICGFLSLPQAPPAESKEERVVREFAVLLDAYESYISRSGKDSSTSSVPTISERFMGLKAAVLTNDSAVKSFAEFLGFTGVQFDDLSTNSLLRLLGFQDEKVLETSDFDLVFVHIGSKDVELINGFIGGVMQAVQYGSDISSRLHLSVVMSYGAVSENDDSLLNFSLQEEVTPDVSMLVPRQSYTISKESAYKARHHCPMLIAQWQEAVTRTDTAESFSFKEFKENGANLAIPADRFLHEVAFKLWKAPKYGA